MIFLMILSSDVICHVDRQKETAPFGTVPRLVFLLLLYRYARIFEALASLSTVSAIISSSTARTDLISFNGTKLCPT